jgi:hypothetical protein
VRHPRILICRAIVGFGKEALDSGLELDERSVTVARR